MQRIASLQSRAHLAAENVHLRKQLALTECGKPIGPMMRRFITLVLLAHLIDWRAVLTIVKPGTLIRWHRQGFRLFWKWKSRPGRPRIHAVRSTIGSAGALDIRRRVRPRKEERNGSIILAEHWIEKFSHDTVDRQSAVKATVGDTITNRGDGVPPWP